MVEFFEVTRFLIKACEYFLIATIAFMIGVRLLQAGFGREGGRFLSRPLRWIDLLLPLALFFCILTMAYVRPSMLGFAAISLAVWALNPPKVQE